MTTYAAKARRTPGLELSFRRLMLNQTVDDEEGYLPLPEWRACAGDIDPEALRGLPCYGGLDLSATRDLTSFSLWFPTVRKVLSWSWLPEHGLEEKAAQDSVPYLEWRDQGWLRTTPGKIVNRRAIALQLAEIAGTYDIKGIGYDTWRIEELLSTMIEEGLDRLIEIMTPFRQGFVSMNGPMDRLEQLVLERELVHGNNPVLTAAVSNCRPARDPAELRKPCKIKALGRIDPLVATLMAVGLWASAPPDDDSHTPFKGKTGGLVSGRVAPLQRLQRGAHHAA